MAPLVQNLFEEAEKRLVNALEEGNKEPPTLEPARRERNSIASLCFANSLPSFVRRIIAIWLRLLCFPNTGRCSVEAAAPPPPWSRCDPRCPRYRSLEDRIRLNEEQPESAFFCDVASSWCDGKPRSTSLIYLAKALTKTRGCRVVQTQVRFN